MKSHQNKEAIAGPVLPLVYAIPAMSAHIKGVDVMQVEDFAWCLLRVAMSSMYTIPTEGRDVTQADLLRARKKLDEMLYKMWSGDNERLDQQNKERGKSC